MNLSEELNSLDPAFASSRSPIWMCAQLFNGLVSLDSALNVQAAIAHSWNISPDGLRYTFSLRRDVYFHRDSCFGEVPTRRVTAADFVYSFSRICDPAVGAKGFWIFKDKIPGIPAFRDGQSDRVAGFTALNDSTLQIELLRPFPPFLGLLAMPYAYVVPAEAVHYYGDNFQAHPVGTGPFQLYRWIAGQRLILHRNPHYFEMEQGAQLPYLDAVSVSFINSRLSAFIAFTHGKLDFIGDLDVSYKDEILRQDGSIKADYAERYQFILAPQLNTEYLCFLGDSSLEQMQGHPFSDLRVRQALNHALDRPKMVRYLLNGMGYPAVSGFVPQGMPGFDSIAVPGYRYNPQRARTLLAEAGYPEGKGLPALTLYSTANYAHISVFVQKAFEQIGVQLDVQNLEGGTLRTESKASRLRFWRASWIADYPDPENYLALFYSPLIVPAGPNVSHFSHPRFDSLYQVALNISTDSLRYSVYQEMDRLVMEHAPIIALYYDRSLRILQPGIQGMVSNPMNHLFLSRVNKDRSVLSRSVEN